MGLLFWALAVLLMLALLLKLVGEYEDLGQAWLRGEPISTRHVGLTTFTRPRSGVAGPRDSNVDGSWPSGGSDESQLVGDLENPPTIFEAVQRPRRAERLRETHDSEMV